MSTRQTLRTALAPRWWPWHLLLVDDEKALREAVAEQLTAQGFVVTQAADGKAALARLGEFAYDIVITDLRLPGADGRKVLQEARGRYPDIIAIVITGYGTVKDAVELIKQGANDFITKPFQPNDFRETVLDLIR